MLAAALIFAQAAAGQVAIGAQAPATVGACQTFAVVVRVAAAGHVAPLLTPPSFAPFQLVRRTSRPSVTSGPRGDQSITVEHRYVLTSERPGTYTLAPFIADLSGNVARSRPLRITVQAAAQGDAPAIVKRADIDPGREVNFRALAIPDTVYVGEQVQYEVAVFLDERVRNRLRRSPTFFPPDMQGMLAYDLPAARGEPPRRHVDGRCLDVLVYQRAVFPLEPGRTVIPPAQLSYALPAGAGLFSREESHELLTDSVEVVALALPEAGRPADDVGAVGNLAVAARVDSPRGRVGDPVTLTLRVAGEANIKLLPRPRLSLPWATIVPDGERVEVDTTSMRVRGAKEFDWLVTPRTSGALVVPPVEYPHFRPATRDYVVARTDSLTLDIEPAPLAQMDTAVVERRLALRARYRGPLGAALHAHPAVWLLAMAAPLPALYGTIRRRSRGRPAAVSPGDLLQALDGTRAGVRDVRRTFVGAVAERLQLPAGVFTRAGALERALRRSGVTRACAAEAEQFLRQLDRAAYAGEATASCDAGEAAQAARRLYRTIDEEALARWELGPAVSLALVMVLAGSLAAAAHAYYARDAADFAQASAQYGSGEYRAAADRFERLALREPRAADAWANHGTAAWAAADTAAAVVGWQRALRLEPSAADVRWRLELVRIEPRGAPGHVPPVGVTPLALSALLLWILAWGVAARPPARGSALRATGIAAAAASVLFAGLAVVVDERLAADDAAVLRRGSPLSLSPAIGAPRGARAYTGEVGTTGGHERGWTHVRFDGARAGWVPSSELVSIARAPVRD